MVSGPLSGELGLITGLEQDGDVFTGGPVFVDQDLLPSLADLLSHRGLFCFMLSVTPSLEERIQFQRHTCVCTQACV